MLLRLENISKTYGVRDHSFYALKQINLSFEKGYLYAIMGKSGCGKSTLLNIIGGLTTMTDGSLFYQDQKIDFSKRKALGAYRWKHIGFLVQNFALISNKTAYDNIRLPLQTMSRDEKAQAVYNIAKQLQIEHLLDRYPYEMSGGECQRVAIARALIHRPECILADEPTGSLDSENAGNIMHILRESVIQGTTIILVTHDQDIADQCDFIIHLRDGEMIDPAGLS